MKYYRPNPGEPGHYSFFYEADESGCNQYRLRTDDINRLSVNFAWFEQSGRYYRIDKEQFDSILGRTKKAPLTFREKILEVF